MNIGSLYTVKKYFWLLYPTKETADAPYADAATASDTAAGAAATAAYWSTQLNCEVTWFKPNNYIVFLEEEDKFKKVLTSDGKIGWIWLVESYNECFEEVKTEP